MPFFPASSQNGVPRRLLVTVGSDCGTRRERRQPPYAPAGGAEGRAGGGGDVGAIREDARRREEEEEAGGRPRRSEDDPVSLPEKDGPLPLLRDRELGAVRLRVALQEVEDERASGREAG